MNEHRPPDDSLATIVSDVSGTDASGTPRDGASIDTGDSYTHVRRIIRRTYCWAVPAGVVGSVLVLLPPVAETGVFSGRWLNVMGVTLLACAVAGLAQGIVLLKTADIVMAKGVMGWILIVEGALAVMAKLLKWTDLDLSGLIFVLVFMGAHFVRQSRELRRAGHQRTAGRAEVGR